MGASTLIINKTLYRDQINKTANAIKDIIQGLKKNSAPAHVLTGPVRSFSMAAISASVPESIAP